MTSGRCGALMLSALVLAGGRALADEPDLRACVAAYEDGQLAMRQGELRRARERLLVCARAPCPREMWGDCARWLEQVDQRTPSVVLAARDAAGRDVTDVRVTMDGKPLVDRLDSRALDVDPGEHRFAFKWGEREPVEASVLVHEGEKSRLVVVRLEPEGGAPSATPSVPSESGRASGAPVAAYVLGGIGLAALGSFAYFGLTGRADYFALKDSCAPHCSASQGSPVATKLLVADISLGVSVVALGAAAYLFLRTSSASSAPPQRAFALDVSVGPTGASAGAHGAF